MKISLVKYISQFPQVMPAPLTKLQVALTRMLALVSLTMVVIFPGNATAQGMSINPGDIHKEQRVFSSHMDTAEHDLDQAQRSYRSGTYNLAWVNISNAGLQLDEAKPKMEGHPQRIAQCSILINANSRREKMRNDFYQIRDRFYDINRKVIALEIDVGKQLGIDITYMRQLREAVNLILPHITDPALRSKLETLLRQYEEAVRSGDTKRVAQLQKEIEALLKQAIDQNPSLGNIIPAETLENLRKGGSGELNDQQGTGQHNDQQGGSQHTDQQGGNQQGSSTGTDSTSQDSTGGQSYGTSPSAGAGGNTPTGPNGFTGQVDVGGGIIIDFNGGKGVQSEYIGERGARLVKETEYVLLSLPPNLEVGPGEVREWNLRLQPVPGSMQQNAESYTARLRVTDPANSDNFTITGWRVIGANGQTVAEGPGSTEYDLDIQQSGSYTIEARGKSAWGSAFTLRTQIDIRL